MCHPAIAIGVGALGAIHQHNQQAKAFEENAVAANNAKILEDSAANEDLALQQEAAAEEKINRGLEGQQQKATALVAAGEAGVSGNSVDALVNELEAGVLRGNTMTTRNFAVDQLGHQRRLDSNKRTAQSRINSVAKPSAVATGLQIAGTVAANTSYTKADGFGFKQ